MSDAPHETAAAGAAPAAHRQQHEEAPLGITPATGPDEVSRQLSQLAQQNFGNTKRRLEQAAGIASPNAGGLTGDMLCSSNAKELLRWFQDEGPGNPPVLESTIDLIRRKLRLGAAAAAAAAGCPDVPIKDWTGQESRAFLLWVAAQLKRQKPRANMRKVAELALQNEMDASDWERCSTVESLRDFFNTELDTAPDPPMTVLSAQDIFRHLRTAGAAEATASSGGTAATTLADLRSAAQ